MRSSEKLNSVFIRIFSLFFRDGVGDGQVDYVATHEVEAIKAKLNEIYTAQGGKLDEDNQVQFLFMVVTKRVNTRIFFDRKNPDAGTCVDDIITLPERYIMKNFFFYLERKPIT